MVTIVDETTAGRGHDAWQMEIFEERRLPLREVIRRRVFQDRELDGAHPYEHGRVGPNRQYDRALQARITFLRLVPLVGA